MSDKTVAEAFNWHMPVDVRFGPDCSAGLGAALQDRQALVLAFPPAQALGLQARWQDALGPRVRRWVTVNDGLASMAQARELAAQVWPLLEPDTVLVAVGGGTTLDLAKLLRCKPVNGRFDALAAALRGQAPWPALTRQALWLVPTTAGTGSEVTRWATVWDTVPETAGHPARKLSLDEPWGYAERAFVDPLLTLSCPSHVTRDTALDALAHALEALWNRHANSTSTGLAVGSAQSIIQHLPAVLANPGDEALRGHLALAALHAGLAFSQTRTALAHALSYDLTLHQGLPHGHACALWLPTAWQLAMGRSPACDAALQAVFACPASQGLGQLQSWLLALGINTAPAGFLALGITDAPTRIEAALNSPRGRNFIGATAA